MNNLKEVFLVLIVLVLVFSFVGCEQVGEAIKLQNRDLQAPTVGKEPFKIEDKELPLKKPAMEIQPGTIPMIEKKWGSICEKDEHCLEHLKCYKGRCSTIGKRCFGHDECDIENEFCNINQHVCYEKFEDIMTCTDAVMCKSGICENGFCGGSGCVVDADCPAGKFCDHDSGSCFFIKRIELLKDTKFEWGFTAHRDSNLIESERCEMPVEGKKPSWAITEIVTETHFCKNLPNPKTADPIVFLESK